MSPIKPSIILYKKLLVQSLKIKQHRERGFTLIELLAAMAILTIVVGLTGTGLVFIISTNTKSDRQITQQANLRRAADFVADEIKSASFVSNIGVDLPTTPPLPSPPPSPPPASFLYLEIPVPVESGTATTTAPLALTLTVTNHGLSVGDTVRFSGTNLSTVGITNNKATYSVSSITKDTFKVVPTSTPSTTAIPGDLAVLRLVGYSIANTPGSTWVGPKVLYRATRSGACSPPSVPIPNANCQVVIDSLSSFTAPVVAPRVTIDLNAQLCIPATPTNSCATPETSTISTISISRATLK